MAHGVKEVPVPACYDRPSREETPARKGLAVLNTAHTVAPRWILAQEAFFMTTGR